MRRHVSQIVAGGIIVLLVYVSWRQAVLTGRSARDRLVAARSGAPAVAVRYPSVAFVATCRPSHVASDDPILRPGIPGASHEHQFFGSRGVAAESVISDLRASPTTCDDAADHASYWLPTVRGAQWTALRAYYSAGQLDPITIIAYPLGLQMIGGPSGAGDTGGATVAWSCDRRVGADGWTAQPPSSCAGGVPLAVRVSFPQCWDGVGRSSSSVTGVVDGICPASHPRSLPRLQIRATLSATPDDFVLSSGATATMHADFWNAWDPNRLATLVAVCIRGERSTNTEITICGSR